MLYYIIFSLNSLISFTCLDITFKLLIATLTHTIVSILTSYFHPSFSVLFTIPKAFFSLLTTASVINKQKCSLFILCLFLLLQFMFISFLYFFSSHHVHELFREGFTLRNIVFNLWLKVNPFAAIRTAITIRLPFLPDIPPVARNFPNICVPHVSPLKYFYVDLEIHYIYVYLNCLVNYI